MSNTSDYHAIYCRMLTLALFGGIAFGAATAIRKLVRFKRKLNDILQERAPYHAGEIGIPQLLYSRVEGTPVETTSVPEIKGIDRNGAPNLMTKESFTYDDLFPWEKELYKIITDSDVAFAISIPLGIWSVFALGKGVHRLFEQVYGNYLIDKEKARKAKLEEEFRRALNAAIRSQKSAGLQKSALLDSFAKSVAEKLDQMGETLDAILKALEYGGRTLWTVPVAAGLSLGLLSFVTFIPIFTRLYKKNISYKAETAARKRIVINDLPTPQAIILHPQDFKSIKTTAIEIQD